MVFREYRQYQRSEVKLDFDKDEVKKKVNVKFIVKVYFKNKKHESSTNHWNYRSRRFLFS